MKTKKLLAVLLSLVMALSLLPVSTVWGAGDISAEKDGPGTFDPGTIDPGTTDPGRQLEGITVVTTTVPYLNKDGEWIETQSAAKIISSINALDRGWYAVTEDVTINGDITLSGDVTLILADGKTLTVNGEIIGMNENRSYNITVYGQRAGTGKLKVYNDDTSSLEVSAIKCGILNLYGGVIEAQTADKASYGANRAVVAGIVNVAGGNLTAVAGSIKEALPADMYSLNFGLHAYDTFTLSGGTVTAKSGDVDTSDKMDQTYAVIAGAATVSGGTLVTDYEGTNAESRCDIYTDYTFKMTGGTFKSARESEAVNASCSTIDVSGGTVKLEKGSFFCISAAGEKTIDSILAPTSYCYYHGSEVDVTNLNVIGDISSSSERVYIVPFGEEPDEDMANSAIATASTKGSKTVYIQNEEQLADALTDEDTESIKLLSDITLGSDILEDWCVEDEDFGEAFPIKAKKLTLDLNNRVLKFEGEYSLYIANNFVIKDSGKNKSGCLYTEYPVVVVGDISNQILGTAQLTVESGALRCECLIASYADIVVSGGSIVAEASDPTSALTYLLMGAKLTITKGLVESAVSVGDVCSFEMTGGKLGLGEGSAQTNEYIGVVGVQGELSSVKISGGSLKMLYVGTDADVQLSGGEFEEVEYGGDNAVVRLLAPGYAFYRAEREEVPVSATSGRVRNVIVKPHTCSFAEDAGEDSSCACGREKLGVSGSAEGAIAKTTYRSGAETRTVYIDSFGMLAEALAAPYMTTITLLSDVEYNLTDDELDIPVNSNTVLDLNGHTLDLSRKDATGNVDHIAALYVGGSSIATFTVKDSSANKTGLIKAGALGVNLESKVNLQGGKITCMNTRDPNVVYGSLVISGGTLDVYGLVISRASLTVTGGVLKGEILSLNDYNGMGKSVLSIAEGQEEQEKQNVFDWAPLVPEAKETGDNLLVTGGEVKVGEIMVMYGYSAKIAGGKIGFLSEDKPSYLLNYGGNVAISGGEIELYADARYTEASADEKEIGSTVFKGGKFGSIWIPMASESDVLGYLEDGYAYYSTETGNVTVPVIDEETSSEEGDAYILNNVEVKSHSCTFNEKGYCACGRRGKANVTAVRYIDESGNEKQTTTYKKLTGEETKLTAGWYVAEGNITASAPITLEGDVNLILTDGSSFTVNGNIVQSDEKKGTFAVYGQKNGSGSITASGAGHTFTAQGETFTSNLAFYLNHMVVNGGIVNANGGNAGAYTSGGILTIGDLTVNGGVINATGADYETEAEDGVPSYFSYGIYVYGLSGDANVYGDGITVNGGVVNAIGGNVTVTDGDGRDVYGYSTGINACTMMTVNGGGVTAKAQTVSVEAEDGGEAESDGIYASNFEMNGGTVNAIGGDASIEGDETVMEYFYAGSFGIKGEDFNVNGGKLNAAADDVAAEGRMVYQTSAGISSESLWVFGGSITLRDASELASASAVKNAARAWIIYMTGGSIEIIGNYDDDIWCNRNMNFSGGTIKAGTDGAVSAYIGQGFWYNGGNIKLDRLDAGTLYQGEDVDVGAILAEGYTFYGSDYTWLNRRNSEDSWSNVHISNVCVEVFLNKEDVETGITVDLSFLPDRGQNEKYAIYKVDDKITASINEETGLLTVKANSSTVIGGFDVYVSKGTEFNPKNSVIEVVVQTTERKVATVTLSGGLEKVYDGLELDSSAINAIATVKDGEQVLQGTWYWYAPDGPFAVMDGTVTAAFVPVSDSYSMICYEIPVKITAKPLTGEPSYTVIEEAGKTLADAALQANKAWPKGTVSWVDENGNYLSDDTIVAANKEYKWSFRPSESASYMGLEGTVTLYTGSDSEEGSEGSGSSGSSGGSGGRRDNTTTTTTKNPDGSTTTVKENKTTGTVTETTKNPDGSTVTKETEKDGTVTTTEKDNKGNTVETVQKPDGEITTTEKRKDGTTVTTTTGEDGTTKSEIKASKNKETEVTVPVENAENVTKITVTDADGNTTEITEFEKTENGIKLNVSGSCTVEITSEKGEDKPEDKPAKKSFKDVPGHWGEDAISFMVEKGLMNGISEDEFAPDGTLTRAMLVTILYRAAGQPAVNKGIPFGDVVADSYYADAVNWAQQNGIVSGITENEFAPDENITREQIATILYRFAKAMGYDVSVGEDTNILSYTDAEEISEYAVEAMCYAVGSGLLKGKTESTLNPGDNATRAELATIIQRFLKMYA